MILLFVFAALVARAGAGEAVENAVHLVLHGHTAHEAETLMPAGDAHQDIEHGCVGHFHACPCCSHQPVTHSHQELNILPDNECTESLSWLEQSRVEEGTRAAIFRPPIHA